MNPIVGNRYIDALLKLMLLSAIFHIALLIVYSLSHHDGSLLNYFGIVNLNLYFPHIADGGVADPIAIAIMVGLYVIIYLLSAKRASIGEV